METNKIKALRISAGLTQEGLARACNLTSANVNRLERGVIDLMRVRFETAIKLADALGVDIKDLYE